ncbi:MAG TPA: sensor histidine kinase [Piscirickettsiaceae bacterium]|nr:sensor histidine kinase [Piscirickettsiaceae bacterium]HIQ40872.1 sensor histidine kinase [Sulfurivirga caldicuralii]
MLLSIRTRILLLLILLLFFPLLVYRLALDFNRQLLEQQIIQQSQTVQNLALILENRPDLWSMQIFQGNPTRQLHHLDLSRSTLWIVNQQGNTTYVIGRLAPQQEQTRFSEAPFEWIGKTTIRLIHNLFPHTLPYLIPFESDPEQSLIRQVLQGATAQRFRFDDQGRPISLMSATPLYLHNQFQGGIVLEQRVDSLFGPRLKRFYHIVGIGTLVILLLISAFGFYAITLSNRIRRLQQDVAHAFDPKRHRLQNFSDTQTPLWQQDEVDQLRHQIHELLQALRHYETYLRQLPKALRHELHNPLNRLHLSLQRLKQTGALTPYLDQAQRGVEQLQYILNALSEAGSIEQSIEQTRPHPYRLDEMLRAYFHAQQERYGPRLQIHMNESNAIWVCGDGFLLEQALDKLIENAMDFSQDGTVTVTLSANREAAIIEVSNPGQLPQALNAEQIFNGMTSLRSPAQENRRPHLGLGLYIARLITEFHHGQIIAQQVEDQVIFQITLPRCRPEDAS